MLVFAPLAFALVSHVFASASVADDQLTKQMAKLSLAPETFSPSPALESAITECDLTFKAYVGAAIELAWISSNTKCTPDQLQTYAEKTGKEKSRAKEACSKVGAALKADVEAKIKAIELATVSGETPLNNSNQKLEDMLKSQLSGFLGKYANLSKTRDEAWHAYYTSFSEIDRLVEKIIIEKENGTTVSAQIYYQRGYDITESVKAVRKAWMAAYFNAAMARKMTTKGFNYLLSLVEKRRREKNKTALARELFTDQQPLV